MFDFKSYMIGLVAGIIIIELINYFKIKRIINKYEKGMK